MASTYKQGFPESIRDFFQMFPWWVGPPAIALAYFVPRLIGGDWSGHSNPILSFTGQFFLMVAPMLAVLILCIWLVALLYQYSDRQRIKLMKECDDYRKMSWRDFERMFAEVLRSQGYKVELRGGDMPDDGIDIIATRNGKVTVIQCKHWKDSRVGIKIVREMYGVMTAEKADEVMIVTAGVITNPCYKFADGKPIHLIDGIRLLEMIKASQKDGGQPAAEQETTPAPSPKCPKCGSPMVMRKARKGPRAGNNFWGCSMYPRCRASRSIAPDDPTPQDQRK